MKKVFFFVFLGLIVLGGCHNGQEQTYKMITDTKSGKQMLVGKISRDVLFSEPFKQWAQKEYDDYQVDNVALDSVKLPEFKLVIVLGTWCPDSRREVPRMFKILDYLHYPSGSVEIYCVDRNKTAGDYDIKDLNIVRIPTFIFYVNGQEKGRIIESPNKSLEQDMIDILIR